MKPTPPTRWPFPTWRGQPLPKPKRETLAQRLAKLPAAPF